MCLCCVKPFGIKGLIEGIAFPRLCSSEGGGQPGCQSTPAHAAGLRHPLSAPPQLWGTLGACGQLG